MMTDNDYRVKARKLYAHDGELEVDDNAKVSRAEDHGNQEGAYVQMWVWVPADEGGAP